MTHKGEEHYQKRSFNWLYGHVKEESFRRRFTSRTAIKKMAALRIWLGRRSVFRSFYGM